MREIKVRIDEEHRAAFTDELAEMDVDFVVTEGAGWMADSVVVEFTVPTDAVGEILETLDESAVEREQYTIISPVEAAMTPNAELLMDRYASDFDPLSTPELRSKARDLSRDPGSFAAMIFLSAVIATVGLLTRSPAVIVGSMVIAPIVGPVLTGGVGTLTADRMMVVHSALLQVGGLVVSVGGAILAAVFFRTTSLAPVPLDLAWIHPIASRGAPSFLSILVGLVAGGTAGFGLSTKGPTSLIGVMIAAALIPAAAAVGVAAVWGYPLMALGAALLLVSTMLAVNVGVTVVLWTLGYRPEGWSGWFFGDSAWAAAVAASLLVAVTAVSGVVFAGTYQHVVFERTVTDEVQGTLDDPAYADVSIVEIRTQYGGDEPLSSSKSVTVVLSRPSGKPHPEMATTLRERIAAATGKNVGVRVRFVEYQRAPAERPKAVASRHPDMVRAGGPTSPPPA